MPDENREQLLAQRAVAVSAAAPKLALIVGITTEITPILS